MRDGVGGVREGGCVGGGVSEPVVSHFFPLFLSITCM